MWHAYTYLSFFVQCHPIPALSPKTILRLYTSSREDDKFGQECRQDDQRNLWHCVMVPSHSWLNLVRSINVPWGGIEAEKLNPPHDLRSGVDYHQQQQQLLQSFLRMAGGYKHISFRAINSQFIWQIATIGSGIRKGHTHPILLCYTIWPGHMGTNRGANHWKHLLWLRPFLHFWHDWLLPYLLTVTFTVQSSFRSEKELLLNKFPNVNETCAARWKPANHE